MGIPPEPAKTSSESRIFRFGAFELDPEAVRLTRRGRTVRLQPKVLELLEVLVRNPDRLWSREELLDAVWPDTHVTEEVLTQCVRKLRRALGDSARHPRYVETVPKAGYRLVVAVEVAPRSPRYPARPRRLWVAWTAAAVLLASGLIGALWRTIARPVGTQALALRGLQSRRLTFTPVREQEGSFFPDGRSYVFVANDEDQGQFDVYRALVMGGHRARLTATPGDEFYPRVSPDANQVAFSRVDRGGERSDVWAIPSLGGEERLLAINASYADWSPDGKEIAFRRRSPSGWSVVRKHLEDGQERSIAQWSRPFVSLRWAPDGTQLAFTDESRVLVVDADGGLARGLGQPAEYIRSVAWDSSSQALVCDANWGGRANLWRLPLAGGPPEPITAGSGGIYHPAVSADGRRVLYTREAQLRQLVRFDAHGAEPRALRTKTTIDCFDVDPSGEWLAVTDLDAGLNLETVALLHLPTLAPRRLANRELPARCPSFSPDGERVALVGLGRDEGLWLVDPDSGEGRLLVSPEQAAPERDCPPAWSPDGQQIAFSSLGGSIGRGLLVASRDGAQVRSMASEVQGCASWSPNGSPIAVSTSAGTVLVEPESGRTRTLSNRASYNMAPVWGPEGESLTLLLDERQRPVLVTLDLEGRETASPLHLAITPDPSFWGIFQGRRTSGGDWLALQIRYESDLYLLEAAATDPD